MLSLALSMPGLFTRPRGSAASPGQFPGPDDTPLENVPGWVRRGGFPGKGKVKDGKLATVAGDDTAYVLEEMANANISAEATIYDVTTQQGYVAPLIFSEIGFVGTTHVPEVTGGSPAPAKLKAVKKLGNVETVLGEVEQPVLSGDKIGGITFEGDYFITYNSAVVGGPYTIC